MEKEKTAIQELKEYFEQQLRLQRNSKIKYTAEEALVDAIEVCQNSIKKERDQLISFGYTQIQYLDSELGDLFCRKNPEEIYKETYLDDHSSEERRKWRCEKTLRVYEDSIKFLEGKEYEQVDTDTEGLCLVNEGGDDFEVGKIWEKYFVPVDGEKQQIGMVGTSGKSDKVKELDVLFENVPEISKDFNDFVAEKIEQQEKILQRKEIDEEDLRKVIKF